jgi:hypothetical protein
VKAADFPGANDCSRQPDIGKSDGPVLPSEEGGVNSPLAYIGGKSKLSKQIIERMPEH